MYKPQSKLTIKKQIIDKKIIINKFKSTTKSICSAQFSTYRYSIGLGVICHLFLKCVSFVDSFFNVPKKKPIRKFTHKNKIKNWIWLICFGRKRGREIDLRSNLIRRWRIHCEIGVNYFLPLVTKAERRSEEFQKVWEQSLEREETFCYCVGLSEMKMKIIF